jgi:hypothetical protein
MSDAKKAKRYFHEGVQCYVENVSYDFRTRTGRIDMPEGSHTDMTGAIDLIRAIDPEARRIETFADGKPDTTYVHADKRDHWQAILFDTGASRAGRPAAHFPRKRAAR